MDPYRYQSLLSPDHLRLVQIHPAISPDDQINISIRQVELRSLPTYLALSYTWGNPMFKSRSVESHNTSTPSCSQPPKTIVCDGQVIPVFDNLFDAPHQLRCHEYYCSVSWWIDALCINQADTLERNDQVALMGSIYSAAQTVVVWLGIGGEDLDAYCRFEQSLIKPMLHLSDEQGQTRMKQYHADDDELWGKIGLEKADYPPNEWTKVNAFYQRAWFSRVWIVQEVALAKEIEVQCGSKGLDWAALAGFGDLIAEAHWFQERDEVLSTRGQEQCMWPGWRISSLLRVSREARAQNPDAEEMEKLDKWFESFDLITRATARFLRTVQDNRIFEAKAPRDKINARLGIAGRFNGFESIGISADYRLSTAEFYTQTSIAILEKSGSLTVLSLCEGGAFRDSSEIVDLPSWVPDFSLAHVADSLSLSKYKASGPRDLVCGGRLFSLATGGRLELDGFLLDTIEDLGGTLQYLRFASDFATDWEMFHKLEPKYFNGQDQIEVIWRTLIADQAPDFSSPLPSSFVMQFRSFLLFLGSVLLDRFPRSPPNDYWSPYEQLREVDGTSTILPSVADIVQARDNLSEHLEEWKADPRPAQKSKSSVGDMQAYHQAIVAAISGRRLFRSHNTGYLGLCPFYSMPGDEIWLIRGSRVPFVLRRMPAASTVEGRDLHEVIGESYVHGIMHGQALEFEGFNWKKIFLK